MKFLSSLLALILTFPALAQAPRITTLNASCVKYVASGICITQPQFEALAGGGGSTGSAAFIGEVHTTTGVCSLGTFEADGVPKNRVTYSDLFSYYNSLTPALPYGTGDGSTTFGIPDFRGRFLRGQANGSTLDPDRATRTAMAAGGATGDNVGSVQGDGTGPHTHTLTSSRASQAVFPGGVADDGAFDHSSLTTVAGGGNRRPQETFTNTAIANSTGTESRPKNAYVKFCVRYSGIQVAVASVADATPTSNGIIRLAGDLGGVANAPLVPGLLLKAPIASPVLTGDPQAPTPAVGDNDTSIITSAFYNANLPTRDVLATSTSPTAASLIPYETILVTTGATNLTVTFPAAEVAKKGRKFIVRKLDTGAGKVILSPVNGTSLDQQAILTKQGDTKTFVATGSVWEEVSFTRQNTSNLVAVKSGNQSITAGAASTVITNWGPKIYPTNGADFNTTTGVYTFSQTGVFRGRCSVQTSGTITTNSSIRLFFGGTASSGSVVGTGFLQGNPFYSSGLATYTPILEVNKTIFANAGTTLDCRLNNTGGGAQTVNGTVAPCAFNPGTGQIECTVTSNTGDTHTQFSVEQIQ